MHFAQGDFLYKRALDLKTYSMKFSAFQCQTKEEEKMVGLTQTSPCQGPRPEGCAGQGTSCLQHFLIKVNLSS